MVGNTEQLLGRHSNEWNRQNAETYGPLSKLAGPFAVSNSTPLYLVLLTGIYFFDVAYMDQRLRPKGTVQHRDQGPGRLAQECRGSQVSAAVHRHQVPE